MVYELLRYKQNYLAIRKGKLIQHDVDKSDMRYMTNFYCDIFRDFKVYLHTGFYMIFETKKKDVYALPGLSRTIWKAGEKTEIKVFWVDKKKHTCWPEI